MSALPAHSVVRVVLRRTSLALATCSLVLSGGAVALLGTPAGAAGPGESGPADSAQGREWLGDGVGTWKVRRSGERSWLVTWRADARLPFSSDRPRILLRGVEPDVTRLRGDGRTLEVVVVADTAPAIADLDVVLSGDRLDVSGDDVARRAPEDSSATRVRQTLLPDDPAAPGPYPVVSSDYELDPVAVAGMRKPVEMVGHVVEPAADADTGPRPLVLFMHGRHSYCYIPDSDAMGEDWPCVGEWKEIPGQLGYDYAQRVLASQGFATVSIRVNGINAQDWRLADGGATARARVVQAHLEHWAGLAADRQVDMSRVVLVGHSRGGEGVNRASIITPLDAPYLIVGQVLLAPTNFGTQTAPYVPTTTVLPYCDGDVYDLQGQRFTDVGRDVADDDTSLKSSVLVMGANHNFFNTEWTPGLAVAPSWDDWSGGDRAVCGTEHADRLSPQEQQAAGSAVIAASARLFARGEQQWLPLLDGSGATASSVRDGALLSHRVGGGNDVRRPGLDATRSLPDGADTRLCRALAGSTPRDCDPSSGGLGIGPHWDQPWLPGPLPDEMRMTWTAAGQAGGLEFERALDLTGRQLELRVVTDPAAGAVPLDVRVTDTAGSSVTVTPSSPALRRMPGRLYVRKLWAQTVAVDAADLAGIDRASVARVELVTRTASGQLWLLDVSAAEPALVDVPARRLPWISTGRVRLTEGTGGLVEGAVPFRVHGSLERPATVRAQVMGDREIRGRGTQTIDLAAGQENGQVRFLYQADDDWDLPRRVQVALWGVGGVMGADWLGQAVIRDDDPAPQISVSAPRRIVEGEAAVWTLTVSQPLDIPVWIAITPARGPRTLRPIRLGDLPPRWLATHYVEGPASTPFHRAPVWLEGNLRRGRTTFQVRIPTLADSRSEPTEVIALRFRLLGQKVVRAVRVRDR